MSPAFDAAWEQTGQADRVVLAAKAQSPAVTTLTDRTVTVPITTTQQILARQFVGPPMPSKRLIGTFSMVVRCSESNAAANAFLAYVLRVLSQDGGTVRGTLASSMTNAGTEFVTTAATRIFSAASLTPLTTQPGDRVVLELGAHAQAPASAQSAVLRFGNSAASDFALTSALTTDLNPWCEFSDDIFGALPSNYQFARGGAGMVFGERIR